MTLYEEEWMPSCQKTSKKQKNKASRYKEDEKPIKKLICSNVTPTSADTRFNLVIYYKSRKTANLIMKNSCLPSPLQEVNVVYQHKCTVGDCSHLNSRYIIFTTITLSKRITAHLQDGIICRHYVTKHGIVLKRKSTWSKNTEVLEKVNDIKTQDDGSYAPIFRETYYQHPTEIRRFSALQMATP
ncbi:hypothetical protein E2C01_096660 [Portunus trituberculatus]|uniref:Uncharacterized protein n=1 Tax=Portunus trituberculatus TaxID=210409 RepID=A0A5B7K917_PORTR|nr:hypothetical protein [Portunus trituberculatus]